MIRDDVASLNTRREGEGSEIDECANEFEDRIVWSGPTLPGSKGCGPMFGLSVLE